MACQSPIWIRNRRYYDKKRPQMVLRYADDDHRSALALRPYDVVRQWLAVPCGHCEDCLRRLRNDWYVRLERELRYCKDYKKEAIFVTITINPLHYKKALADPSSFIRAFNERIRRKLGHSVKHAYFQEFGEHPQTGGSNRLHFHGFMFGINCSYNTIRSAVSDFGFIWIGRATHRRARYVVKYVCKQLNIYDKDGNLIIDPNIDDIRKYTRKFISPGVGNYLGNFARPSASVATWSYTDWKTRCTYEYTIPRYYDRYLTEESRLIREVRSADAYSRFSSDPLVNHVVRFFVERTLPTNSLARRTSYNWMNKKSLEFAKAGENDKAFLPPAWLSYDILDYWRRAYGLDIPLKLLRFKNGFSPFYLLFNFTNCSSWQNNLSLAT